MFQVFNKQVKNWRPAVSDRRLSKPRLVNFVTMVKISKPSIKQYPSSSSPATFLIHFLPFQNFETDLSKASLLFCFSIFRWKHWKHGDLNKLSENHIFLAWSLLYLCISKLLLTGSFWNWYFPPGCCTEIEGSRDHGAGLSSPG